MRGLREFLYDQIKKRKYITYQEMTEFCRTYGLIKRDIPYRQSNGERRLRELSQSDEITIVYNTKGFIQGYRLREEQMSLI